MEKTALIYKKIGETPLEALERFRAEQIEKVPEQAPAWKSVPMTYAGRLDPMAEGELLILIGDECKNKEKYLGLDKEYEVEIVFGISTDTGDALGIATIDSNAGVGSINIEKLDLNKFVGKFMQPYPAYSSKAVGGKQLHELARANQLPKEMPEREVEIYAIELLGTNKITADKLEARISNNINLVTGDFRQSEIKGKWNEVLHDSQQQFEVIKVSVKCSGGTYMRSLAEKIGKVMEKGSFALTIKRTRIIQKQP